MDTIKAEIVDLLYSEANRRDKCAELTAPVLGCEWRRTAAMMRVAAKVVEAHGVPDRNTMARPEGATL